MPTQPLPVICDRCQAEGLAGEGDFAGLGDLLDFEPVPLQVNRVDGWTPECQRAFIAALSVTGSAARAAGAIGKSAPGAERLRRLPGSESFILAWERAKAISQERGTLRLANSLRTARVDSVPPPPEPPAPPRAPGLDPEEEREGMRALETLFGYYRDRLQLEREARLAGRVVEADFFVRQVTAFEVYMEALVGETQVLKRIWELSIDGDPVLDVAETTMSRLLDTARREKWAELAEPRRPSSLEPGQMRERDGYRLFRSEVDVPRDGMKYADWVAAREAEYAAAARAQVEWEEQNRREAEEWRARQAEAKAAGEAKAPETPDPPLLLLPPPPGESAGRPAAEPEADGE
jgi:hypothetical protein